MPFLMPILTLLSLSTWAAHPRIDVKAELLRNGKPVASPRVITVAGKETIVVQNNGQDRLRMKVLAHPTTKKMDEMKLDFDLEYKSGDKVLRSQPQVFARSGSEAIMTLEESLEGEKIQFRILAQPHEEF